MPDAHTAPVLALPDEAARVEISLRALDAAPIGMAITDARGVVVWANAVFAALVRATGPVQGRRVDELVDVDRSEEAAAGLAAVLAGERPSYAVEERWLVPGGDERTVLLSAALADGATPHVVLQALDTTERRRAEQELRRSNDELTQFAYVASHDLSEPLRVIAGHVELLAARYGDKLDDDARRWIDFAVDGCSRMRALIDDLLAYSRAGRELTIADVDLDALAAHVAAEAGEAVAAGRVGAARADRMLVTQTLRNLVSNALKFTRDGVEPRVEISGERVGREVVVTVADNGIGIEEKHRERVFSVFQRLHARADYAGTGIGLSIVRKAVEQMGGRVWIEDSALGGAAVRFTLPAATEGDPA